MNSNLFLRSRSGFTIVELLIVIVVIAILAAITTVSYNGITVRAQESALKSDLKTAATQLQLAFVESGAFPANTDGIKKNDETVFNYTHDNNDGSFCVTATNPSLTSKSFYIDQSGLVQEGQCPPPSMQGFTASKCDALSVYTGANPEAIITLADPRGETTRTYEIAKLADGNCWMLTNLKLGSLTGTTELSSADTNLASGTTFTLPQVGTDPTDLDYPRAYGPVPSDTGSGATNYGYLYNWPAATAGETIETKPTGSVASYSICPAGWRLPTGNTGGDFSALDIAFGGTGAYSSGGPSSSSWLYAGPFKGVFSGYRSSSFGGQGTYGHLWSSSAHSSNANNAFNATFVSSTVYAGTNNTNRNTGYGVRCLLN